MTEEQMNVPAEKSVETKKFNLKTWHLFVLGIVGILLVAVLVLYGLEVRAVYAVSNNKYVVAAAKFLKLPAAKVNRDKVLYVDYLNDLNTLKKFYQNKPAGFPDATPEQMSDQVISRLIANKLIEENVKQYNVTVTKEDVEKFKTELVKQFPDPKKAEEELMNMYGWTLDTYLKRVVEPIILEQKLQAAFTSSTDEAGKAFEEQEIQASHILFPVNKGDNEETVKAKAQKVLDRIKNGEDFAKLAKDFGSDATKDSGGDLGWFGRGQMVKEFEDAAFVLEPGQLSSEPVKTQFGFHLIKVTDKKVSRNFVNFMDRQLRGANIRILININNPFSKLLTPEADSVATSTK